MTLGIKFLDNEYSICKLQSLGDFDMTGDFFFIARTPEEISLVCPTEKIPGNPLTVNHGWRAFRVEGVLDFNLVGILSSISQILAANGISIVALSTFDTDYVLVKMDKVEATREALAGAGYQVG